MDRLSFENFEKEFDRRKVQALNKVNYKEYKEIRINPFMEEMIENIRKAA
jgi:ribosome recycling factor